MQVFPDWPGAESPVELDVSIFYNDKYHYYSWNPCDINHDKILCDILYFKIKAGRSRFLKYQSFSMHI